MTIFYGAIKSVTIKNSNLSLLLYNYRKKNSTYNGSNMFVIMYFFVKAILNTLIL